MWFVYRRHTVYLSLSVGCGFRPLASLVLSPGSARSCGCIMLFRPALALVRSWFDDAGRYVQAEFSFQDSCFRVLCVYAPNRNPARDLFFDQLDALVDPSIPTVLCGDFNTVFDRSLDRAGSCIDDVSRESTLALTRLFDSCCVVDIWRCLHQTASSFTWSRWDGSLSSRIDLFGSPYSWIASVQGCDILPCPFSDHCAVLFSVVVAQVVTRGPGRWKLNVSFLDDPEYVSLISDFLLGWRRRQNQYSSLTKWWDVCKDRIKGLSINFGVAKSRASCGQRDLLVRLAEHLKSKLDLGNLSCLGPYNSTLAELAKFDLKAAQGAQVRSRVRWVEESESSSAFFFRLERKRGADRRISALKAADGTTVSDTTGLCDVITSFYSDLFRSQATDNISRASLLRRVSSTLSSIEAQSCEGLLSLEECKVALFGMARRKAPGSDGLPMEFYLKFWDLLGDDLVCVLNSCFRLGRLSLSQRRGVISLSFKKGDCLDIRNWRPISLLNVDYKLAARALPVGFLRSSMLLLLGIRPVVSPVDLLVRMLPFLGMLLTLPPCPTPLWHYSLLIKKKLLIGLNGPSCGTPFSQWALGHLLSAGLTFFTMTFRVLLMLMATFRLSFRFLVAFVRDVLSRPFCTSWLLKFCHVTSVQTLGSMVYCCLRLFLRCQLSHSMLMTRPSLLRLMILLGPPLTRILFLKKVLVLS